MDLKSFIESKYSTSLDALNFINITLVNWQKVGKSQRFGQFIESSVDGLNIPQDVFYNEDPYIVYSWCVDIVFEIYTC